MICGCLLVFGLFQRNAPDQRFEQIGVAREAEIGEMKAVDGRFAVGADNVVGREIMEIVIFGCKAIEVLFP